MKQKITLIRLMILFSFIGTSICTIQARQFESGYSLLLNSGNYSTQANLHDFAREFRSASKVHEPTIYRIIQFYEIPKRQTHEILAQNGITLYDYVPNFAYLAAIATNARIDLLETHKARGVYEILNAYKLSFEMITGEYPSHALHADGQVEVFIHFFPGLSLENKKQLISSSGATLVSKGMFENEFIVKTNPEQIKRLASQPAIYYIEPINPPGEPENNTARTLHRSNVINNDNPLGRRYDGTGVRVMLQDDGIVGPHIDYQGRIPMQYVSFNNGDHGDHIAGIIMGAGNLDPRLKGMAPGSLLYVYAASGLAGFNSLSTHYNSPGIRITSTSYSDGCNTGYTTNARNMDQQMRIYPKLMHVFSSGNEGATNCAYGAGAGWGNITGGHKSGKNVISVGNLTDLDVLSSSSSRGPAKDGRIKPEVCAKGSSVNSTTNPNLYVVKSGTSMSCPGVSGTLAQLYHAYKNLNNQAEPNGALMKAVVMNTADDIGNTGPDFRHGFGRINAYRAILTLEGFQHDSAEIDQEETKIHSIIVPPGLSQLKIMLYWTDYEGIPGTTLPLVNNLDLSVNSPTGTRFSPWILDHTPDPLKLNALATRGTDSINNVEQVTIDAPPPGVYRARVTGKLVPQPYQKYFITWDFVKPEIAFTYPIGNESFVPGETEIIRWDASTSTSTFSVSYSGDAGNSWVLIGSNIPAGQRYLSWVLPASLNGNYLLRLTRDQQEMITASPFSIVRLPANLSVVWACSNSFRIRWDEVYGAKGYVVRLLGEKYMDSVAYTTQNSYIFSGIGQSENWAAVQAVMPNGAISRRTVAVIRAAGVSNCNETDLAAEAIPSSEWTVFQNCTDLNNFKIDLRLRNNAPNLASNFSVGYRVNNGLPVVQDLIASLKPDSLYVAKFADAFNISQPGTYVIKAWVSHPQDANRSNDTITRQVRVIEGNAIAAGNYLQTFDNFTRCLSTPTCQAFTCTLADNWTNLINNTEDQIDWRTYGGGTPTGSTGPSFDHTTGTSVGNYLYLEPNTLCYYREAILVTPCFDLTNSPNAVARFWYHLFGIDMGRLHVDALVNGNILRDVVEPLTGNMGDQWREMIIRNLPAGIVAFRFRGVTGGGHASDMAIDDFEITTPVGVGDQLLTNQAIRIFPNPGTGIFNLSLSGFHQSDATVLVTDMLGKTVIQQKLVIKGSFYNSPLDLTKMPDGVYLISVQNSQGRIYQKLVKQ